MLRRILSAPVALVLVGDEALGEGAGEDTAPGSFIVLTAEKRYTLRATSRASAEEWAAAFRMVVGTRVASRTCAPAPHGDHRAHRAHHKDRAHGRQHRHRHHHHHRW